MTSTRRRRLAWPLRRVRLARSIWLMYRHDARLLRKKAEWIFRPGRRRDPKNTLAARSSASRDRPDARIEANLLAG
jgi:hypothetical protein